MSGSENEGSTLACTTTTRFHSLPPSKCPLLTLLSNLLLPQFWGKLSSHKQFKIRRQDHAGDTSIPTYGFLMGHLVTQYWELNVETRCLYHANLSCQFLRAYSGGIAVVATTKSFMIDSLWSVLSWATAYIARSDELVPVHEHLYHHKSVFKVPLFLSVYCPV